jgi:hypothetical protein
MVKMDNENVGWRGTVSAKKREHKQKFRGGTRQNFFGAPRLPG